MTSETRRSVWIALGQVALVLLSVGLGIALSEWRQGRADDERARLVIEGAVREIVTNRGRVQEAYDYHEVLLDSLRGGLESINLAPAFVVDNAWETAQAVGSVADLPYPVVEALARTHEVQGVYQSLVGTNLGLLYFGNVFNSDQLPSSARGYAPNVSDLRYFEGQLLDLYAETLVALDAAGFAVADSLLNR